MQNKVIKLGSSIKGVNGVMVLTGAGMDTESNISDFRSKDGLWGKWTLGLWRI